MRATTGRPLIFSHTVSLEHSCTHSLVPGLRLLPSKSRIEKSRGRLRSPRSWRHARLAPHRERPLTLLKRIPEAHTPSDIAQETMTEHYYQIKNSPASDCADYSASRLRQNNCTSPVPTFLLYTWNTAHLLSREPYILSKQIYRAIYLLPGKTLAQIINIINEV